MESKVAMIRYYKKKMQEAHTAWQEALDNGKEISAAAHMEEYNNYSDLLAARVAAERKKEK